MNTTEKNKLIAEFLELPKNENGTFEIPQFGTIRPNGDFKTEFEDFNLKFHSSWDWLMQVVEKIESLGNDVLITSNYIQITYNDGEEFIVIELEGNIKIFAVYNACVEFIEWFNSQKK